MQDKNPFADMKRAKEEEYFKKKERELIEKMKERAVAEQGRQQLAEASGIADEEVLNALFDLGYTRDTVSLLHVVPLLYVAWAEGHVSPAERELILEAAGLRGVQEGTAAHDELKKWLEHRPSHEFFENTLRVISNLLGASEVNKEADSRSDLLAYCRKIAQASGGILGLGRKVSPEEEAALARISRMLERGRQKVIDDAIKGR